MNALVIRPGALDDAGGLNAIYNPVIRQCAATFEVVEYDDAQRRDWIACHIGEPRHPLFVAVGGSAKISGFAYAAPFDRRGAYETSVKVSVFVAPEQQGARIGAKLYESLFGALGRTDIHRAYALVVAPNPASLALHQRFGFAHVATLNEVGRKFGRFHDVMWFEKRF